MQPIRQLATSWLTRTQIPLAFLGLVYLLVYSLGVIYPNSRFQNLFEFTSNSIWVIFALDVLFRALAARTLFGFLKSSWLELITLALPFVRVARVFRAALAVRSIKGLMQDRLHATGIYTAALLPLTWYCGAIAVLDAESGSPEATITSLAEALWWSLTTITTVGYGDLYPQTLEGKVVAAALMITGIALFSAVAGMFVTWINKKPV